MCEDSQKPAKVQFFLLNTLKTIGLPRDRVCVVSHFKVISRVSGVAQVSSKGCVTRAARSLRLASREFFLRSLANRFLDRHIAIDPPLGRGEG